MADSGGHAARRTALVTGGASGIGLAVSRRLAADGLAVVIADLDGQLADAAATEISAGGGAAVSVQADVADEASNERMVARALEAFGSLDVLALNAGIGSSSAPFESMDLGTWNRLFSVNVTSMFLGTRAALPALRRSGNACLVLTASLMGVRPRAGYSAYGSTKAAVAHFAQSLALELAPDGIRVNAVAPTATETPMFKVFAGALGEDRGREVFSNAIPLGRLASAEDVAGAVSYLVSEDAAFITGQVIRIDGGRGI